MQFVVQGLRRDQGKDYFFNRCVITGHCLPRPVVLAGPFHILSGRFRPILPEPLPQGGRQQRATVERDEPEEDEDWGGLDADFEGMVKVVDLKTLWWASLLCDVSEWHFSVD